MIFLYFVKTKTIDFTNNANFCIYKIDGLAPPGATLNFSTIANVDGEVYNSGRINKRNIVLYIKMFSDVEQNRNALYEHFPLGKVVRIYFRNGLHDIYIDGYVETFECDLFSNNEAAQVSIICNDPYFRSAKKETLVLSVSEARFEFPFSINIGEPIPVSERNYSTSGIINAGLVSTGMVVEFKAIGKITSRPWLTNLTSNQTMKLTGTETTLNQGEKITVNTNKHHLSIVKTFTDGTTKNILNTMDESFEWVQLLPGKNRLTYGADEKPENLLVTITVDKLLLGV